MQRARERRYSCCTEGEMWLQKGRYGYAPDISPNNNNVQKDDGGQTAFTIMEVNDTAGKPREGICGIYTMA